MFLIAWLLAAQLSADRPWVSMVALAIDPSIPTVGKPLEVIATLKNTGRTPARNVKGHVVFEGVIKDEAPNFNYDGLLKIDLPAMPPGTNHFARFDISRSFSTGEVAPVTQQMLDRMASGQNVLFAHGRIDYEDRDGNPHWVEWCYFLTPDFKSWERYGSHNGSDTDKPQQDQPQQR